MIATDLIQKLRHKFSLPLMAFSVSTELELVRGNNPDLWIEPGREYILAEYFNSLIRLGATQIQTYVAGDLAEWLIESGQPETC